MKIAIIYRDSFSNVYCGEIRNEKKKVIHFRMSKSYTEILTWSREHHCRLVDLDVQKLLEDWL
jgi:hypothetical protein